MASQALREIIGPIIGPDGAPYALKTVTVTRTPRLANPQGSSVVMDQPVTFTTDANGDFSIDLVAGGYVVSGALTDAIRAFEITVPDAPGPFVLADLMDQGPLSDAALSTVQGLVIEARAWAQNSEGVEPNPGTYPGEFSARHWSEKSREWAETPEGIEVDAGQFSAKHHALRAASDADRAGVARDDAQGVLPDRLRRDVATLLADTALTYTAAQPGTVAAGDIIRTRAEGFAYSVAASGATDQHVTTAGGVRLYVLQGDVGYNVRAFGAKGDGVADDLPAIQTAISALKSVGGGTVHFPNGTYRVTGEILIDSPSVRLTGTGRRKVYPGLFVPSADGLPTIMPVHSGDAAVRFFSVTINTASTFSAQDLNFATLETGSRPTRCFGFDGSGNFHRDYTFDRVGVQGFTSAFDTYNTGGDLTFGLIKIVNCAINRNGYIARTLTGQWNGFVFEKNEAGQNLIGGLDIRAQSASIRQNAMEGQPNTIRFSGNYRGITIAENYFELNSGAYCVQISQTLGAIVENNFWQNITSAEPLSLVYDIGTIVRDRIIPSTLGSFGLQCEQSAINPVPTGKASAAFFASDLHVKSMLNGFTELGNYQITPAGPHYAFPESAGNIITSAGTGLTSITKTSLSIASGNYIAVSFLVSYQDDPVLPPVFELVVNNTNADGFINPQFYNFNISSIRPKNKTILYFGIVKSNAPCTSLGVRIYPFGLNPVAGLVCYYSLPAIYDLGATIPATQNVGAGVPAFIPESHVQRVVAAPVAGAWPRGYKLHARAPAAEGFEGWICTTAGTPGTWKTFGAISA